TAGPGSWTLDSSGWFVDQWYLSDLVNEPDSAWTAVGSGIATAADHGRRSGFRSLPAGADPDRFVWYFDGGCLRHGTGWIVHHCRAFGGCGRGRASPVDGRVHGWIPFGGFVRHDFRCVGSRYYSRLNRDSGRLLCRRCCDARVVAGGCFPVARDT